MKHRGKRLAALFLALTLPLTACGGGKAAAATMHLIKTEGEVKVDDAEGKSVQLMENLGLFSGYGVDTRSESFAWIDLDEVKLTKMDQDSQIEIRKEGEKLEIEVKSGSLFFRVTEPLAEDETMEIRASTMLVGIRGTCGWVTLSEDGDRLSVCLLEGRVQCEADGANETVQAGEMAVMTTAGEITVEKFTAADIPAFVREEIEEDSDLAQAILDSSGIDLTGGTSSGNLDDYADILDKIRDGGYEVLHAEVLDFEADGKPELLVIENTPSFGDYITIQIWRKGMTENALMGFSAMSYNVNGTGITSLAKNDGRLFLRIQRTQTYPNSPGDFHTETVYAGSVAQEEGSREDWGWVDMFECSQNGSEIHCSKYLHDERGFSGIDREELTAGEFAAAQAQYNELKVLVYYTSDGGAVVLPDPSEIEEFSPPAATEPDAPPEAGPAG